MSKRKKKKLQRRRLSKPHLVGLVETYVIGGYTVERLAHGQYTRHTIRCTQRDQMMHVDISHNPSGRPVAHVFARKQSIYPWALSDAKLSDIVDTRFRTIVNLAAAYVDSEPDMNIGEFMDAALGAHGYSQCSEVPSD
jgi:hypothetical protein